MAKSSQYTHYMQRVDIENQPAYDIEKQVKRTMFNY